MKKITKLSWLFCLVLIIPLMISCKKDESKPQAMASFTFAPDATDFKTIIFTNESQNYTTSSWDFGDGSAVSTETNPTHTFPGVGTYTVKLTVSNDNNSDIYQADVTISDPDAELTKLVGDVSKTWKLIRVTTSGRYPLEVGPIDHSQIWWAMGKDNNELANRPCMLNDEWTFYRDGTMVYDPKGDYWAEGGWFVPDNVCNTTDQMVGPNGEDLTAWGGGTFTFTLEGGGNPTITANGMGAFIGFFKLGNDAETKVPLDHVTYNLVKLSDDDVDTLIVEGNYHSADPTFTGGYWRFVLVHYDDPNQEPPIPGNIPSANFSMAISGLTVAFTNTTTFGDTYSWDFGDGSTSTEMSPVHTYATDGIYNVTLTASNANGTNSMTQVAFVSNSVLTDEILQGAAWRVRAEEKSVFVGSGLGKSDWWSLPKSFLTGGGTGADDWSCMPDDEFTFSAGGVFTYNTMGSARNDGYFGTPNGCWSDAEIAASPGAPFGSATHSYTFTPATGTDRPIILLTNGAGYAAFLGFYKGFYGGENTSNANPPNGGFETNKYEVMGYANTGAKEYLFVSVDITADHSGGAAWSVILER